MSKLPDELIKTAKMCGIEHMLKAKGHFYLEKNQVLSSFEPEGVRMEKQETANGVEARVVIEKGASIDEPLFFCFGILDKKYDQFVVPNIVVQEGARVKIVAHCGFPHAEEVSHLMQAKFTVEKNAIFEYEEHHYHGKKSGASVIPKLKVEIGEGGQFFSNFNLSKGTVGKVRIEVEAVLARAAKIHVETKVLGNNKLDDIEIIDKVYLSGRDSRSLIKMRAAAKDGGRVLMQGETYANAAGAVGHVDCQEIVVGQGSVARAIPIVEVNNENARVTHEASVGKINQKELETLMTRGLSEDEATELIIQAMMK